MFKIKATDGTNNLCGRRVALIRKEKKLSQRKLAAKMQILGFDVDHYFIRRVAYGGLQRQLVRWSTAAVR